MALCDVEKGKKRGKKINKETVTDDRFNCWKC